MIKDAIIKNLLELAWVARERAIVRKTKVGAAVLAGVGCYYSGCNIEHDYCKSFHAEEVAIMKALSEGHTKIWAIVIVAEMEHFTPCGNCRDWIMQFLTPDGSIGVQSKKDGPVTWYELKDLYPFVPVKTKPL